MDRVPDLATMPLLLQQWIVKDARAIAPAGRWCIQRPEGPARHRWAILFALPSANEDLEIDWQLHPNIWGHGYASETTYALAQWAFSQGRTRSSRSLGRITPVPQPQCAATAWSGSAKPASTLG